MHLAISLLTLLYDRTAQTNVERLQSTDRQDLVDSFNLEGRKLKASFLKTIEHYIFPNGQGFTNYVTRGVTPVSEPAEKDGKPKINSVHMRKSATIQLGGTFYMAQFNFPERIQRKLKEFLNNGSDWTLALHLIFAFWLMGFKTTYIDSQAKTRVAYVLHLINNVFSTDKIAKMLGVHSPHTTALMHAAPHAATHF